MKLKSIITSNHDLKKNGYKIIRKLHKMEKTKNLELAYNAKCDEGFFWVLSYKNLLEFIKKQYGEAENINSVEIFIQKSEKFLKYLEMVSHTHTRINKRVLAAYLNSYTSFFNDVEYLGFKFKITQELLTEWNLRCVMAYIAAWGER